MKILFVARHYTYFRNYDSAIRELAARGHQLHLAVEVEDKLGGDAAVRALVADRPPSRAAWCRLAARTRGAAWRDVFALASTTSAISTLSTTLRRSGVCARETEHRGSSRHSPTPPFVGGPGWQPCRRQMAACPRCGCSAAVHGRRLSARRSRLTSVLITPLVDLGSQQIDYVRAARQLGIPCGLAVWSWDHLSSKALHPRISGPGVRLERDAAARGGAGARRARRSGGRHRRAVLRPLVRRAGRRGRASSSAAQLGLPVDRPIVLYVCTGAHQGQPAGAGRSCASGLTRLRASSRSARRDGGRAGPAASRRCPQLERRRPVAISAGGCLGRQSDGRAVARRLLRLAVSQRRGRRPEHQRVHRGRHRRPRGAHDSRAAASTTTRKARRTSATCCRLAADCSASAATSAKHLTQLGEALRRPRAIGAPAPRVSRSRSCGRRGSIVTATPVFVRRCRGARSPAGLRHRHPRQVRWRRAVLGGVVKTASVVLGDRLTRSPRELDPARQARIAAARSQQTDHSR